jgi:hypothetical protein
MRAPEGRNEGDEEDAGGNECRVIAKDVLFLIRGLPFTGGLC